VEYLIDIPQTSPYVVTVNSSSRHSFNIGGEEVLCMSVFRFLNACGGRARVSIPLLTMQGRVSSTERVAGESKIYARFKERYSRIYQFW